jgi:hypothetical protein
MSLATQIATPKEWLPRKSQRVLKKIRSIAALFVSPACFLEIS